MEKIKELLRKPIVLPVAALIIGIIL